MGDEGIGPSTSVLSGQRSTTELIAHILKFYQKNQFLANKDIKKQGRFRASDPFWYRSLPLGRKKLLKNWWTADRGNLVGIKPIFVGHN